MTVINHVVVHYAEIGLKSSNRGQFEKILMLNILRKLGRAAAECYRECGMLVIRLNPDSDPDAVRQTLACIPGIAYVSPAAGVDSTMAAFEQAALDLIEGVPFATFRVETLRRDKANAFHSMQVNREIGAAVLRRLPDRKVRLESPDLTLRIEIGARHAFVSRERIEGVGGLPTDTRQPVVALLSGGLDSPVAAYLMMKRGCQAILVHFQNRNHVTDAVEAKITGLAGQLSRFQIRTELLIVPFEELQQEIIKHVPSAQRMLFYRRVMLKLAQRIAVRKRARFLVTGDSLSQVASQTYDNLAATYRDSDLPVLAPLIGMDKKEIDALARRIGTYALSALPYEDCCSLFVPRHPELRAHADTLRQADDRMMIEDAMARAIASARMRTFE